jgi:trk system potassium uptake protein
MLNSKVIIKIMGLLLIGESIAMLFPLIVSLLYSGSDILSFIISIFITFLFGLLAFYFGKKGNDQIGKREGYVIVASVWIFFSFFGALPFVIQGHIPSYTDAFFETMSGFSTTGSSILEDIESLPHGLLFWRSMTQWLGGMGIIVLSLAILPIFGIGGMQLFIAEVPGPTLDKLRPRISQTAMHLWGIYFIFTIAETVLLTIGGMSFFDAICHSFTTMATGGYSTKQASIAYWDSAYIQYVIVLFMFLAGTNFTISYYAIHRKFNKIRGNEEFKWYCYFTIFFSFIIAVGLFFTTNLGIEKSIRDSIFQVVTIMTTTGYATTDYMGWYPVLIILLFALFFFGGSAGSTGGGIKIVRIVLLLKNGWYEFRRLIHPNAVIPVTINKRMVTDQIMLNVLAFFMIYIIVFFGSVIILTFTEPDLPSAMGAVATSMGNIGPGLGKFGPAFTFYSMSDFGKWFLSFLMLLGRLELFTILVLFTPAFWKK